MTRFRDNRKKLSGISLFGSKHVKGGLNQTKIYFFTVNATVYKYCYVGHLETNWI